MRYTILLLTCLIGFWSAFKGFLLNRGFLKLVGTAPNGRVVSVNQSYSRVINTVDLERIQPIVNSTKPNRSHNTSASSSVRATHDIIDKNKIITIHNNESSSINPRFNRISENDNFAKASPIENSTTSSELQGNLTLSHRISDDGAVTLGIIASGAIIGTPLVIVSTIMFYEIFKNLLRGGPIS